jgi:diketogulonate reductase-like aldo/keto reductase
MHFLNTPRYKKQISLTVPQLFNKINMASSPKNIVMNDGLVIPAIGLGVYKSAPGEETYAAVLSALSVGYRHIDTAQVYRNEGDVGRAIEDSNVPRAEIFVTTKLWLSNWGYDTATTAVNESLKLLRTTYIDLILLHAPGDADSRAETWKALEDMKTSGILKSIGVSNFGIPHLQKLEKTARTTPAVNQIEIHPWNQRIDVVKFCNDHGIVVQAYSPLAKAIKLSDPIVCSIAKRLDCTPAQILISWSLAKGFVTLPKSVNPLRQKQNLDTPNVVSLSKDDMIMLDSLEEYLVTGWDPILDATV